MKKLKFSLIFLVSLLIFPTSGYSQFLGQLETAPTLLRGSYSAGGYAGVYDDAFAIFGGFRFGATDYLDWGIKAGILNLDDESGIILGGDLKYFVLDAGIGDPLDLSLGLGTEFSRIQDFSRFSLGGNMIISRDFCLENGRAISPYGRLNLRMERKSGEKTWGPQRYHKDVLPDTDLEMGLCVGTSFELTTRALLVGELQMDEFFGFIIGVNFLY